MKTGIINFYKTANAMKFQAFSTPHKFSIFILFQNNFMPYEMSCLTYGLCKSLNTV